MLKEWSDREPEDEPPYRTGWIPIADITGLSALILWAPSPRSRGLRPVMQPTNRSPDESWSRARQEGWREAKADHEVMA
jgi:ribosome modulation factor